MVGGVGSVSACLECRSPGISGCGKTGEDQPSHVAPRAAAPFWVGGRSLGGAGPTRRAAGSTFRRDGGIGAGCVGGGG
jgi:hypothetical protein